MRLYIYFVRSQREKEEYLFSSPVVCGLTPKLNIHGHDYLKIGLLHL